MRFNGARSPSRRWPSMRPTEHAARLPAASWLLAFALALALFVLAALPSCVAVQVDEAANEQQMLMALLTLTGDTHRDSEATVERTEQAEEQALLDEVNRKEKATEGQTPAHESTSDLSTKHTSSVVVQESTTDPREPVQENTEVTPPVHEEDERAARLLQACIKVPAFPLCGSVIAEKGHFKGPDNVAQQQGLIQEVLLGCKIYPQFDQCTEVLKQIGYDSKTRSTWSQVDRSGVEETGEPENAGTHNDKKEQRFEVFDRSSVGPSGVNGVRLHLTSLSDSELETLYSCHLHHIFNDQCRALMAAAGIYVPVNVARQNPDAAGQYSDAAADIEAKALAAINRIDEHAQVLSKRLRGQLPDMPEMGGQVRLLTHDELCTYFYHKDLCSCDIGTLPCPNNM